MALGISVATSSSGTYRFASSRLIRLHHPTPAILVSPASLLLPPIRTRAAVSKVLGRRGRRSSIAVCFVLQEDGGQSSSSESDEVRLVESTGEVEQQRMSALRLAEKRARKKSERFTYLVAAVMSSFGITSMAVMAVYYRFSWQMEGGEIPMAEMLGTFALSVGAAVGMEFWAPQLAPILGDLMLAVSQLVHKFEA